MSATWRCSNCTTTNGANETSCVVCHAGRQIPAPATDRVPVVPSATAAPPAPPPPGPPPGPPQPNHLAPGPAAHPWPPADGFGSALPAPGPRPGVPWAILAAIVAVVVVVAAVAFVAGRGTSDQPSVASAPTDPTEPGDADQADVELSDPDQPDPDGEGRSTGQTTHPATAEEAALGLERRSALGTTILVPRGWTLSGDPSGTTGRVMFEDPHSPAMLVVDISDCSVCVSAGDEPYPMGAVPADADPTVPDGADVVLYQRPAPSGYETHGVVRVDTDRSGWVEGSTTMEVTVPSSERRLATEILNFT